jgi:hypothetical protein
LGDWGRVVDRDVSRRAAMEEGEIRVLLERHWADIEDQAVVHEIYHEDVELDFPQSGERIVGVANLRAMREAYPGRLTFSIQRMRGRGDLWVTEGIITYDGRPMRTVTIMEFREGKVGRETIYFGEPWEPPAWRAQWTV